MENGRNGKRKTENGKFKTLSLFSVFRFPFSVSLLCVFCVSAANLSCTSSPTDLRTLAPADTLVYLETNDLRKTLESLTGNRAFEELAKEKVDFSALENVQFAVAVTNFETSEQAVADEQSVLNFKPRFVAVADTHRWKPNAVSIAEKSIGKFAREIYGADAKLEKSEKADAKFFVWTSASDEKRKIFAAVSGSVIYVGNDESLIGKCLSVKRGAAESLLKNENLARARNAADAENQIAFGYVSPAGAAQIADVAGVSAAVGWTEDDEARNYIQRVVPQVLQKTIGEISWTATKNEQGIKDKILVSTGADESTIFKETMQVSAQNQTNSAEFLPPDVERATRYDLQNPQAAWRGLFLAAARQIDAGSGEFMAQFSGRLLEPYGISDADAFLSAVDSEILTAQTDDAGEKSVVIAGVKDAEKLKKSIAETNFKSTPEKFGNAEIWKSEDGEFAAAFVENKLVLGDGGTVSRCLEAKNSGQNFTKNQYFQKFQNSRAAATTFEKDSDSAEKIVEILSGTKDENKNLTLVSLTETRFTEKGIEREIVSAFGLIGSILEYF